MEFLFGISYTYVNSLKYELYFADIEMRLGYLGRLSDLPLNGQLLGSHPGIPSDLHRAGHPTGGKKSCLHVTTLFNSVDYL